MINDIKEEEITKWLYAGIARAGVKHNYTDWIGEAWIVANHAIGTRTRNQICAGIIIRRIARAIGKEIYAKQHEQLSTESIDQEWPELLTWNDEETVNMEQLTEKARSILTGVEVEVFNFYMEGDSLPQIAKKIGCNRTCIYPIYNRIIDKLKEQVKE